MLLQFIAKRKCQQADNHESRKTGPAHRQRFDMLSTTMGRMDETDDESFTEDKSVISLTGVDASVAEFINLTKAPEVFDLCSSSSSSTFISLLKLMQQEFCLHRGS